MAEVDARRLLAALKRYKDALDRHQEKVRGQFESMDRSFQRLQAVYGGTAANEFKSQWRAAKSQFKAYEQESAKIRKLLAERVDALEKFDQAGGL